MSMDNLFKCTPNCSLSELTLLDWGITLYLLLITFAVITLLRKWAFEWNQYTASSIKWHIPRFLFITVLLAIVTIPIVWSIFGSIGAKIYGQFIFPEVAFIVYIIWLLATEEPST